MNTMEALAGEIERVATLRERARQLGSGGCYLVTITGISLKKAREAAGSGDLLRVVEALNDLRSYAE